MNEQILLAILEVSKKCNDLGFLYLIGGSGALLVHGVKVSPNDIDLVVDPNDYEKAIKAFGEYRQGEVLLVEEVKVEILNFSINPDDLTRVEIKGISVSVNKLEVELGYYKKRTDKIDKNKEKIRLIEEVLGSKS